MTRVSESLTHSSICIWDLLFLLSCLNEIAVGPPDILVILMYTFAESLSRILSKVLDGRIEA